MDNNMRDFLKSGKTIITDTLAPKSELPKQPKKKVASEPVSIDDPLGNLIKRVKDEDVKKIEVVEVFKKIIEQEESLI